MNKRVKWIKKKPSYLQVVVVIGEGISISGSIDFLVFAGNVEFNEVT